MKEDKNYIPFVVDGLWGVMDENYNEIIPPQYESLIANGAFPKNFFKVIEDDEYYFIDSSNKRVSDSRSLNKEREYYLYSKLNGDKKDMLFALNRGGKAAFYTYDGELAFATEYDYDESDTVFEKDYMTVSKYRQTGLIDRAGKEIIPPKYANIIVYYPDEIREDINVPIAVLFNDNGKIEFMNLQSGYKASRKYDCLIFGNMGNLIVKIDSKWGILNDQEKWLIEPKCVYDKQDGDPYGFFDKLEELLAYDLSALEEFESFVLSGKHIVAYNQRLTKIFLLETDTKQLTCKSMFEVVKRG